MGSSDDETADLEEVECCLKEAEMYTEEMSKKDMLDCFKVINRSKMTASQEKEQRRIIEETDKNCKEVEDILNIKLDGVTIRKSSKRKTPEKSFTPKSWFQSKKLKKDTETRNSSLKEDRDSDSEIIESIETELLGKGDVFNPFDCPPTKHSPLKRVFRKMKYEIPFLFGEELSQLPVHERAKKIYEYHNGLIKRYKMVQGRSKYYAKWGKPIVPNSKFNGSLERFPQETETLSSEENENDAKTDDVSDFDANAEEFDRFLQSEKLKENAEMVQKAETETVLPGKNLTISESAKSSSKSSDGNDETDTMLNKNSNQTPLSTKRRQGKKLTNLEIITRSKLFKDVELEDTLFKYKIPKLSEVKAGDADDKDKGGPGKGNEKVSSTTDEGGNPKKRQSPDLESSSGWIEVSKKKTKTSSMSSPKVQAGSVIDLDEDKTTHEKVSLELKKKYQKQTCPICNQLFFQAEIEEHASRCEAYR